MEGFLGVESGAWVEIGRIWRGLDPGKAYAIARGGGRDRKEGEGIGVGWGRHTYYIPFLNVRCILLANLAPATLHPHAGLFGAGADSMNSNPRTFLEDAEKHFDDAKTANCSFITRPTPACE